MVCHRFMPLPFIALLLTICLLPAGAAEWYPGIIHCHTTFSDGAESVDAVTELMRTELAQYREDGRGFLIVTDHFESLIPKGEAVFHDYVAAVHSASRPESLTMAGLEIEALWTPEEDVVGHSHSVTIGDLPGDAAALSAVWQRLVAAKTPPAGGPTQQEITTAIRDIGMVPVAAHPFQVLTNVNCHDFTTGTEGLRGMEMWYATLPKLTEQGIDSYIQRVAAGEPAMVTSSCDYHRRIQVYLGSLKCVTWVYAEELTPAGIQSAVEAGRTYAVSRGASFTELSPVPGPSAGERTGTLTATARVPKVEPPDTPVMFTLYHDGAVVDQKQVPWQEQLTYTYTCPTPEGEQPGAQWYVLRVGDSIITSPIALYPGATGAQ